jgi:hypothetical protein
MLIAKSFRAFVANGNNRTATARLSWDRTPLAFVRRSCQQLGYLLGSLGPIRTHAARNKQVVGPVGFHDGNLGGAAFAVHVDDYEAIVVAVTFFLGLLDAGQKFFNGQAHECSSKVGHFGQFGHFLKLSKLSKGYGLDSCNLRR